jgi:2-succinyl-5-enolpyruvyl-6-hydroxy-3-cyclohexene-1-carboxylate synthase
VNWNSFCFDDIKPGNKSQSWLKKWKEMEARYIDTTAKVVAEKQVLTDGAVYHHIAPFIPQNWTIFFSNSFPARDHSMFGRWNTQKIFTNRGASGIDGITSTAMGVNIGSGQPGILFTGDLAFLHDTNALLHHQNLVKPLVVVVVNNNGGSIFRMLPVADHQEYFSTYFETPQHADIIKLAESYSNSVQKIETLNQLKQIDLEMLVAESNQALHIIECKTNPEVSMELRKELWGYEL